MATVPTTHTVTDGIATSSEMNTYFRDPIAFLLARPAAELRQTVLQSISTSVWTALTFNVEDLDADPGGTGGHSTSSNTSRFTAVYAGWYLLGGGGGLGANATGQRGVRWAVNGSAVNASWTITTAATSGETVTCARSKRVYLNVGDYVELQIWQASGVSINTLTTADGASSMTVVWDRIG